VGEPFGTLPDGTAVTAFRLRSDDVEVTVLDHGGVVQSILAPDRDGDRADVVLGFDAAEPYATRSPYFGALVGRYANRLANAGFPLDGREYRLEANNGPNTLHGGRGGFDKKRWDAEELGASGVRLSLVSPDGDEGFPGRLAVTVTYTLAADGLRIGYEARNEEAEGGLATVVNLTNHSYWNLAGEGSGSVAEHELRLHASRYTPIDPTSIPTGELAPVEGTPFDFRTPAPVGARWRQGHEQLAHAGGYDHNFVLDGVAGGAPERDGLGLAAVVRDPGSGRVLEVWTDQPGVQFYSSNQLTGQLRGKSGRLYRAGDALCLETQHFPDSPHRPDFPSTRLGPQETFRTATVYRLTTDRE
jgi:aldose 1-epimerase